MRRSNFAPPALAAVLVLMSTAAFAGTSPAAAAQSNPQCVASAANDMAFCKAVCQSDFKSAKDMCRNIDHDCAETCRSGLEGCLDGPDGPLTVLDACRVTCDDNLSTSVTNCRNTTTQDTPERDQCIDAAQVVAFQCRDTCREGVVNGLQQCRDLFKTCILACPPPQ